MQKRAPRIKGDGGNDCKFLRIYLPDLTVAKCLLKNRNLLVPGLVGNLGQ